MKVILLLVVVSMFIYIGISIRNNFKSREKLLNEIVLFLKNLESEIGFLQTKLKVIIAKTNENASKNFKTIICVFEKYLNDSNINEFKKTININALKEQEQEQLTNFFVSLGKGEASDEVYKIKNSLNYFEEKCKQVREENSKYCPLAIKLSFLASLAICVILA